MILKLILIKVIKMIVRLIYNIYLGPVLEAAAGLNAASDNCCNLLLFSMDCDDLTSTASTKSFNEFVCNVGSSTFRQPMHLQLFEHGILA